MAMSEEGLKRAAAQVLAQRAMADKIAMFNNTGAKPDAPSKPSPFARKAVPESDTTAKPEPVTVSPPQQATERPPKDVISPVRSTPSPFKTPVAEPTPVSKTKPEPSTGGDVPSLEDYTSLLKTKVGERVELLSLSEVQAIKDLALLARRKHLEGLVDEIAGPLTKPKAVKFKLDGATRQAVDEADKIIMKPLTLEQRIAALQIEFGETAYIEPAGGNLYRNASSFLEPHVLLGQGVMRGKMVPGNVAAGLIKIFTDPSDAFTVVNSYVTSPTGWGGRAPATGEVAAMSATTDIDNTLGNNPTWQYTFPGPTLEPVPADVIQAQLNVTQVQASRLNGTDYGLFSNSGQINGATVVAFVSKRGSKEHMFLTALPIPADLAFRAYTSGADDTYQTKWKRLNTATLDRYKKLALKYELPL